ncbi:unnamed protein product (macronuclear) [Paramecium tetraurelia]|uniref:Thioredoxin domain-containing protein n=1 Tax=Paramecium tetraurelia TaxID=5888 RepID=A0C365_PARTE|nr:uncharacterized protein GSPATT00034710001 [Paramecium tetraurelia]CAK65232.1 unnamed protein product [Paramecium tetraurelia]|eukprot:XP_001432629.1 hypothetical protein (macronuclear) [Paramecium tetraurelia strain d4-2]
MNCLEINTLKDWFEQVVNNQRPVVVSFFADWCAPCRKLNPQLIQEAEKNTEKWQLVLVNVNNDELYDVVHQCVKAQVPSVCLFNMGTQTDLMTGYSERKIKSFFEKIRS